MKTLTILTLLFATFSYTSFGAETKVETEPGNTNTDIKNRFLELIYEKAVKYTEKGEMALEKAVELAAQETPILMQEFLAYRFFYHTITFSAIVMLEVLLLSIILFMWRKWAKMEYSEYSGWGVGAVIGGIVLIGASIPIIGHNYHHLMSAVQIKVAPRIYIIEQTIDMFKS